MKIVHVAPPLLPEVLSTSGGAIQRRVLELATRQHRRGHEVHVFSPGVEAASRTHDGVVFTMLPVGRSALLDQLRYQWQVSARVRAMRDTVSVVHCHSTPEFAALCRGMNVPIVLSYDEYHFRRGRKTPLFRLVRTMLQRFDRLLPVSDYCATASAAYWELPTERIDVVFNGVNLQQFAPDADAGGGFREEVGLTGHIALYVGRMNEQKGSDVLVEATRLLRDRQVPVTVVAAGPVGQFHGSGHEPRWDLQLADAGGVHLGVVHEAQLPALYNMATVFVMPTRHLEMFGMAVVEAQATGCPVIATDHGGLRETVHLEAGGSLVPVGDADALAHAIARSVRAAPDATIAQRNRTFVSRFDWERICDQLDTIYLDSDRSTPMTSSPLRTGVHHV